MNESSDPPTIRIGTWNINWAKPGSIRGNIISDKLAATDCDVLCVTEGFAGIFPDRGHVIDAGPKWGYPIVEGRRKVLLWSKQRWTHVDSIGSEELPSGRFVAGVTQTSSGSPLTVVGVCIPWFGAHVTHGHKNRKRWQDHEAGSRDSRGCAVGSPRRERLFWETSIRRFRGHGHQRGCMRRCCERLKDSRLRLPGNWKGHRTC